MSPRAGLVLTAVVLAGCSGRQGSGVEASEVRDDLRPPNGQEVDFAGIFIRGEVFVAVTVDPTATEQTVIVTGDDNALDRITTLIPREETTGDFVLRIRRRGYQEVVPPRVDVVTPDLAYISATFNATAAVENVSRLGDGPGGEFRGVVDARSSLTVTGDCDRSLLLAFDSTSDVAAGELICREAELIATRGAEVTGHASELAILRGSGQSTIRVEGNPNACDLDGVESDDTIVIGCP